MWVPLIENNEYNSQGADYFVQQHLGRLLGNSADIDTLLLACTHYPVLTQKIKSFIPDSIQVISQGNIVANSLAEYLGRHPELEAICSKNGCKLFYTTDAAEDFDNHAELFFGERVTSQHLEMHENG